MLFEHVLVATDFSECSEQALDLGIRMADALTARLTIVHAWDVPAYVYTTGTYVTDDMITPVIESARDQLDDAVVRARRRVPGARGLLRRGVARREILDAQTESRADVIVLGTHGRSGLAHVFLGSVAEHVVRAASVPVLTVHASTTLSRARDQESASVPPAAPVF